MEMEKLVIMLISEIVIRMKKIEVVVCGIIRNFIK